MNFYKVLSQQVFTDGEYSIVPIRYEDRLDIMKWRNEQMYHLRQAEKLTAQSQNSYFNNIVSKLFEQEKPSQLLFSFLKNDECIGYGGLVHINWIDKNAEISFIMDTELEKHSFEKNWSVYLKLIEKVAFEDLNFHKIYTYAFDIRPYLYPVLEFSGFVQEAILNEHCLFEDKFIDVLIHSKWNGKFNLRKAVDSDVTITFEWVNNSNVRAYSFSKDIVTIENHQEWFSNKIKSSNCLYLIASDKNNPVGSIRFDINDITATLSYLIDPKCQGNGYGTQILKAGIEKLKNTHQKIKFISGQVIPENKASVHIFKKLNFHSTSQDGVLNFTLNV